MSAPIPFYASLVEGVSLQGMIAADVASFLGQHGFLDTLEHCRRVAEEASRLGQLFGVDPVQAQAAGWLHDISVVIPNERRVEAAQLLAIEVLPEEITFPMIMHQKLSADMAEHIFGQHDPAVLSAIGCHTTLKQDPSQLDKVVFLADKLRWDQWGEPPFLSGLLAALDDSLDRAVFYYLDYLWQGRANMGVIHPWFAAAYQQYSAE